MVRTLSGNLRSTIGLNKQRLIKKTSVANDLYQKSPPPNDKSAETQWLQETDIALCKLQVTIRSLEECDDKWTDLLFKLTDEEEIEAENELHKESSQSGADGGYLTVLEDAKIIAGLLKSMTERIRNTQLQKTPPSLNADSTPASTTKTKAIKLPAIPLPKFDGNPVQWEGFWSVFDATVGASDITNVQKYNYLVQQTAGVAYDAVSRMQVTESSYEEAVAILKERFQRDPLQIQMSLLSELKSLPQANRMTEIRKNHDTCQRIIVQLKTMDCDVDNNMALSLDMWAKYSIAVVKDITQRYGVAYGARPADIQKAVSQYLTDFELLNYLHHDVKPFNSTIHKHDPLEPYSGKVYETSKSYPIAGGTGRREPSPHSTVFVAGENTSDKAYPTSRAVSRRRPPPCHFCTEEHFNSDCDKYTTVSERTHRLKEVGRCTLCYGQNHNASNCKTPAKYFTCYYCNDNTRHKSAMCPTQFPDEKKIKPSATKANGANTTSLLENCSLGTTENTMLMTAVTEVINPETGSKKMVRVILDTGSHRSFVTEELASDLGCNISKDESLQIAVFGSKRSLDVKTGRVNLKLSTRCSSQIQLTFNVVPLITQCHCGAGKLPESVQKRLTALDYAMADNFNPSVGPPSVLIGSEYFWQFIRGEPMQICEALFLVPTMLGLVLSGRYLSEDEQQPATLVCLTERTTESCIAASLQSISTESRSCQSSPDIDEFWSLEKIGITDNPINDDDEKALTRFNESVQFANGRYQICWPWNDQKHRLKSNYQLAVGRLQSLAKRLSSGAQSVVDEYEHVIDYQAATGIIEKVPEAGVRNTTHLVHYLPHHPVVRANHATTKLRIVYDASAKCGKDSVSLNECMYRGPVILPDLCSILIRFRLNKFAIVADIEKAFLQIELQESERDATRFLWFRNTKSLDAINPIVYRFARVPFGIISSPFILGATLQHHLSKARTAVATLVKNNIYVDNVITGTNEFQAAHALYQESKQFFKEASMNLREWCSNSDELMETIPADDRSARRLVKVLGINWNSNKDELNLCCDWDRRQHCRTKREVLKAIASVYDPLGLFQPCTLKAKCFLRKLWLDKLTWDEEITPELQDEWQQLHGTIRPIFEITFPRYINNQPGSTTTLVVFCDASKNAYATAVYIRTQQSSLIPARPGCDKPSVESQQDKLYDTNLVYAKSRLAPKSKLNETDHISIPKLELLGIVIATTAAQFVRDTFNMSSDVRAYIMSDSTITIGWLQSNQLLPVFINNRVKKIRQIVNAEFHHVNGPENPADLLTRGIPGSEIQANEFWWKGPAWLRNDSSKWPTNINTNLVTSEDMRAREFTKTGEISHTILAGEVLRMSKYPLKIDPTCYSSFKRLIRVTAMCMKFFNIHIWQKLDPELREKFQFLDRLCNNTTTQPIIMAQELNEAKLVWVLAAQREELADVMVAVEGGTSHPLLKQLNIYKDSDGLLRCFGRFGYSDLSFESIHPILLPRNCYITNLMIQDAHERLFHAGISHTLSQLRRQYWIPHGRNAVRKVINRCITCRKLNGAPYALPNMPPWPRKRIARSSPFEFTGVDYLGPFNVSVIETVQKMWICLYTCLATRAVHLECIEDCTATSFIDSISRFISRRGAPVEIISDNAPQFRLAKTLFDRTWAAILTDPVVLTYVSDKGVRWKFTTALSPWQGGFYERLVGVVKSSFKSVVGRKLLKREEFVTIVTEVESIVNSRPLTYVCSDARSGIALRPMDFITDRPSGTPSIRDEVRPERGEAGRILLRYWKAKQRRLNQLWRQFYDDYLLSLRERYQISHRNKRSAVDSLPEVNEVVLVKNMDNTPRGTWKLGRITKIISSQDGHSRSVELLLPNHQKIERSISHIHPLEIRSKRTDDATRIDTTTDVEEETPAQNAAAEVGRRDIALDESEFDGFDQNDLAHIPQHLQFLDDTDINVNTIRESTTNIVLAGLTISAASLIV